MNRKTNTLSKTSLSILTALAMASTAAAPYAAFAQEPETGTETAPAEETPGTETQQSAPEQPETPAESETPETTETPAQPAESETPQAPAEAATKVEEETPETPKTPEQTETPAVEEDGEPSLEQQRAASVNGLFDQHVDTSLQGMLSSVMNTSIPVSYSDGTKAGKDTDYTGKAVLNLNLNTLLTPAKEKFDSLIGSWRNASLWPVEGPNRQNAVISINVDLPEGADASFEAGTAVNNSSIVSGVTVTPNGKTAVVQITLNKISYSNLFSMVTAGTAGDVEVTIPYSGHAKAGDVLDGAYITASGSGQLQHITRFGFPINVNVNLTQATGGEFFAKGEPYVFAAGAVDDTVNVESTLNVNDAQPGATVTLKKGDTFSMTGALNVKPIKDTIASKIEKYQDIISELGKVQLANTDTTFNASYTLPAGVEWSQNQADPVFSGSDAFEVRSCSQEGQTIKVVLGLKDAASITNLDQLSQIASGSADELKLTINNLKVSNGIAVNSIQPIKGDVEGTFHSDVTFENGAQYNVNYAFAPTAQAQAAIKVVEPVDMKAEVTIPASLTVEDKAAGEIYTANPGQDFYVTGSIDTTPIKDKLDELVNGHIHASQSPELLPVVGADVQFDAKFVLPEGIEWKDGSQAVFGGSDAFQVASVSKDGQTITAHMTLKDASAVKTLQDLIDIAENSKDALTLKLEGLSIEKGAEGNTEYTIQSSVSGAAKATVTSSMEVPFNVEIDFSAENEPEAKVKAAAPAVVDESIPVESSLRVNNEEPGATAALKKGDTFSLTGALNVTEIKNTINEKIGKYQDIIAELGNVEVANTDTTFDVSYTLPAGVDWSKDQADLIFAGSDAFEVRSFSQEGQTIKAVLGLKDPASITNLQQLADIAEKSADELTLTINNLKVADNAAVNTNLPVVGNADGTFHSDVTFEGGERFDVNFTFTPAKQAEAAIRVEQPIEVKADVAVPAELSIEDLQPGEEYTAPVGEDFSVTGSINTAPIKEKLDEFVKGYEHASQSPDMIPISDADVHFDAVFTLPEGIEWKDGSEAVFTGSDAFKVDSVSKDGQTVTAHMSLKDPASIKTLQDLIDIAENSGDDLSLKLNGLSISNGAKNNQTFTITSKVNGEMTANARSSQNVPFAFDINFTGETEPEGTVKAIVPISVDKVVQLPSDLKAGANREETYQTNPDESFPLSVSLDTAPMKEELKKLVDELDTAKDPKDVKLTNTDAYFDAFFALPAGVNWKEGSEAVLEDNSPFKVVSVVKENNGVRVTLALKDPAAITNAQDLMNLLDNTDQNLILKVNGFSADKDNSGQELNVTAQVSGKLTAKGEDDGRAIQISYTFTSPVSDAKIKVSGEQKPGTDTGNKPGDKPSVNKPSNTGKPGHTSKPGTNSSVNTAANSQAGFFASVLGASAFGAAVLAFFKNKKNR